MQSVFPDNVFHAIAIKTNPLHAVLQHIVNLGFGLEAASYEEVLLANAAGASPSKIVFDSPVKRQSEIDGCDQKYPKLILNANSLQELKRLESCSNVKIGLRINPLVQPGSPDIFNVSTIDSKFGVPISLKPQIVDAFIQYPHLSGLHLHIGSDIQYLEANAIAIKKIYDLAKEIASARKKAGLKTPIDYIDIGGGYPANYDTGEQESMQKYVSLILQYCPDIFDEYQVITEFGRFVHAHCAWWLSDIEYVTDYSTDSPSVLYVHGGGDMFVREIYQPNPIRHQMVIIRDEQV